jgi:hypothetical protein
MDLLFLLNLKAGNQTNIIFGSGIHREQYSEMTFNQHYAGIKTILNNKQDFLDLNGRLTIDYKTEKYPFLEFGLHYNKCFTNSNKVSAFFNIGAMYQNYYSSTDIWALQAGISLNIH